MNLDTLTQFVKSSYHVGDIVLIPNQLADTKKEGRILRPAKLVRFYPHTIEFLDVGSATSCSFRYYDLWLIGHEYLSSLTDSFVDVSAALVNASNWASRTGVIPVTSPTAFSPDTPCTREDVIQFLYRTYGEQQIIFGNVPFADVPSDAKYVDAVKWAVSHGVLTLQSEHDNFRPTDACTHNELVDSLWRIAGKPDVDTNSLFAWAEVTGLFDGVCKEDIFQPDGVCTRGELAQILYNSVDEAEQMYYVPKNRFRVGDVFRVPERFVVGNNINPNSDKEFVGTLTGVYRRYLLFIDNDTKEKLRVVHSHVCDVTLVQHAPMFVNDRDADLVRTIAATS